SGASNYPSASVLSNGLFLGSSSTLTNPCQGDLQWVQTFDWPLPAGSIAQAYSDMTNQMAGGWGGPHVPISGSFYNSRDIWLVIKAFTNSTASIVIHAPVTNAPYDLFMTGQLLGT